VRTAARSGAVQTRDLFAGAGLKEIPALRSNIACRTASGMTERARHHPATGVMRHADARDEQTIDCAERFGLRLAGILG